MFTSPHYAIAISLLIVSLSPAPAASAVDSVKAKCDTPAQTKFKPQNVSYCSVSSGKAICLVNCGIAGTCAETCPSNYRTVFTGNCEFVTPPASSTVGSVVSNCGTLKGNTLSETIALQRAKARKDCAALILAQAGTSCLQSALAFQAACRRADSGIWCFKDGNPPPTPTPASSEATQE